jgi:hypothetical protein
LHSQWFNIRLTICLAFNQQSFDIKDTTCMMFNILLVALLVPFICASALPEAEGLSSDNTMVTSSS